MTTPVFPIIGGELVSAIGQPTGAPATSVAIDAPRDIVSFDTDNFDAAVRHHGVRLLHFRAMRCPIGMISRNDIRKAHAEHAGCSHGFLYTYAGPIYGVFTSNQGGDKNAGPGYVSDGRAMLTPPRFYETTSIPFYATKYDRLYLDHPGIFVCNWETFEAQPDGVDKLSFPIEEVHDLVDADGRRYQQGADFEIVKGRIRWTGARPVAKDGMNPVCGVRYLYRPYWYVTDLPHEIRVARSDMQDGSIGIQRMNQFLALQREYLFESELPLPADGSTTAPLPSARTAPAPPQGSFGPR